MAQYLPLLVLLVLASLFAGLSFVASSLLGQRRRPTPAKVAPYECGIVPDEKPAERFPVRFYLVAMIFIIFDIEIIFLFPWAVVSRKLGPFGLWEMVVFAVAVFVSFVYLLGRGALNWGPRKPETPPPARSGTAPAAPSDMQLPPALSTARSTESTIRRVGGTGRAPVRTGAGPRS